MIGNILIVDDEPAALKLLETILVADGHNVRPFINAELALCAIKADMPELILMDIRMPGMSGFEACQLIKQDERLEEIPIIFISVASNTADITRGFEAGAVDYITKPYIKGEVLARIRTHIKLSHTIQRKSKMAFALRKSEQSLRIAQSMGHFGHWEWDVSTGKIHCSEEMCRLMGCEISDQVIDQTEFLQFVLPADRARVANQLESVPAGNRLDIEFSILLPDGTSRAVHGKGEAIHLNATSQSTVMGDHQHVEDLNQRKVIVVIQDVSEQKATESELRIAAAVFKTHEGVLITDPQGNIIKVNQAFSSISGYSQEFLLGKNPRIMSSGRHDKTYFADIFREVLCNGSWAGEIWNTRRNGEIYAIWQTITAVRDANNNICQLVSLVSDITDRKKNEEVINNLAFYDVLTQLPNRRMLYDRLKLAMATNNRNRIYGAILFIDMDKFKLLNDTHGHDVGDLLLIEVARRINSCVRDMDTVARFGGDEYIVMLNGLNSDESQSRTEASNIAKKIRASLSEPYFLKPQNRSAPENCIEHNCSSSIGIALFNGHEAGMEEVLMRADQAMYQAKASGRDAVHIFEQPIDLTH
jgi:diguanylate cyclase (GGDEF)-like protein/PAS domain S-box-containing protein